MTVDSGERTIPKIPSLFEFFFNFSFELPCISKHDRLQHNRSSDFGFEHAVYGTTFSDDFRSIPSVRERFVRGTKTTNLNAAIAHERPLVQFEYVVENCHIQSTW